MATTSKARTKQVDQLVREALDILQAAGIPLAGLTTRRRERMAKAFLAVAGIKPGQAWLEVQSNETGHRLLSRQVIAFMNEYLGESIADSSYDDIRRKDLVLPVSAGLVLKSATNPNANTNDGTRPYALTPAFAALIRLYATAGWEKGLADFLADQPTLAEQLKRQRHLARVPVTLSDGRKLLFSPGQHNQIQKLVIEAFLPLFGFGAEVLYVGDTANKFLFCDVERLKALAFFELAHDQLPDVVAYSSQRNWLYLIEAVHSANPITELRRRSLKQMAAPCTADIVYVTAFPDRETFRRHVKEIAWETEVWIADAPEHLIHFNGDKFLGPYQGNK